MASFQWNTDVYVGLFLIFCTLALLLFPPKFGNGYYGITTKWTMKNEATWAFGHKLFAVSSLFIGLFCLTLGSLKIHEDIPPIAMVFMIFALWNIFKFFINMIMAKKFRSA
jgi:uncharacterized membrane protein